MSELLTPLGASPEVTDEPARSAEAAEVTRTPVMITEHEVMLATAAAVPLHPAKVRGRWTDVIGVAVRAIFGSSSEPRKRRHYPSRNDYLESSRMAREMHRL